MNVIALPLSPEQLTALLAAFSVALAVLAVTWPYLARNNLAARMQKVEDERQRIRQRERARLAEPSQTPLRVRPRKLYEIIVDRFRLERQAEDGELVMRLKMAGYRGYAPVVTFLAIRLISPVVLFAVAAAYILVVLAPAIPLFATLGIAACIGALGYFAPALVLKNRITKRQTEIRRVWPDVLDLLLICVEAGMSIEGAFRKVAEEISTQSTALAEELSLTTAELSYLQDRRTAYDNLARRTGVEGVRAVVTSLIQAEKYGTSLGHALRVMAQENRDMRLSDAEKKAAALPPKLTVPMILFFLPVLFAVILTPAIIQISAIR
jgi:tight adherence protein C